MRFATVLLITIVLMVMVELSETRRRGGSSRGSRSSRSRSSSGGSSSKPKIIKYTPIKATSVRSPVIVKQTKLGSRSSTFKRVGRKESTTTWLTWQLQWNTKMEKRKYYTESTKKTVSLEDTKDQDFEVVSLASYNMIIVTGTTCTRVENTVQGTMVTMYETNPNGSNRLNINKTLLSVVIMLFVFMNQRVFRYWIKRAYVSLV